MFNAVSCAFSHYEKSNMWIIEMREHVNQMINERIGDALC
jgi:hypothetical protein